ncbi:sulfotransferase family 2 domain-containing protein [Thermodesulfobacteriota bacterium]
MPISYKYKVIFVHIPKTSGTYIENILGMHGDLEKVGLEDTKQGGFGPHNNHLWGGGYQHCSIKELFNILNKDIFDNYIKFTVVRHPYTRILSEIAWKIGYKSWISKGKKMPINILNEELNKIYSNFKKNNKFSDIHLMSQSDYIMMDGKIAVDKIFKFEKHEDIKKFLSSLGADTKQQKRMATDKYEESVYLTKDNKSKIYEMYKKDFEYFSYKF